MKGKRESQKGGALSSYLLPQKVCASCGKPTTGGRTSSSMGEWHYYCRRDASGHLIVRKEAA